MRYRWVWWMLGAAGLVVVAVPAMQLTVGAVWATYEHTAAARHECASLAASSHLDSVTWESGLFPHWTCEWSDASAGTAGGVTLRWYEILIRRSG